MTTHHKCPIHPKQTLRSSYSYPSMLWCDKCKDAWNPEDLNNKSNKIILFKNLSDRVTSPDYPFLYLNIDESEIKELQKLKKEREDFINRHSTMKNLKFNIDPFFKEAQCLQKLVFKKEDQTAQEDLEEQMKKKTFIQDNKLDLDLKRCRAKSLKLAYCELIISGSGVSVQNNSSDDYDHIESSILLWKDFGIV
jgi:hypothetical protein